MCETIHNQFYSVVFLPQSLDSLIFTPHKLRTNCRVKDKDKVMDGGNRNEEKMRQKMKLPSESVQAFKGRRKRQNSLQCSIELHRIGSALNLDVLSGDQFGDLVSDR